MSARDRDAQFTVALQGFSAFERSALASFFRLAAERSPNYRQVDRADESDFLIADADHAASLQAVLATGRQNDTVWVGQQAPEDAAAWLKRPIVPTRIVRELDALVALRRASAPVSLAALAAQAAITAKASPSSAPRASTAPSLLDLPPAIVLGDPVEPLAMPVVSGRAPTVRSPKLAPVEPTGPDVLIVEDSRIARRFLQQRLQRLGYRVHLASDGDEALEQFTQRSFALVLLDVELGSAGSIDGFALCQHLKQHPDFAGDRAPRVAIVTGQHSATARVRGELAGCDAYLVKPLLEAEFMQALHRLDPALRARQAQALGAP